MASIVAADLVAYHAATQSDVDGSTVGGAVDPLRRVGFTQVTAGDTVEVISTSASDTQNCTIEARKADGSVVSETVALTGTTAKIFSGNGAIDRILKVELASVAIGTITVRKSVAGVTYSTIPVGERGFSAIFRKGSSSAGGTVNYYAKFFWKNTNSTNVLLDAQVSESADPTGLITHAMETTVGGSGTTTNRQTVPASGITAFGNTAITLLTATGTANLAIGASIGVWLLLALATNNAAIRSTYTSQISGSTT